MPPTLRINVVALGFVLLPWYVHHATAQNQAPPAAQDAEVVGDQQIPDLTKLPRMEGATVRQQGLAMLSYEVASGVPDAFEFQMNELSKLGWKRLEGSYESDTSCYATLDRKGYKLSASVSAAGTEGTCNVTLIQHGNVDFGELPLPADMKPFFAGPASASYLTTVPVKESQEACRELLIKDGWMPYGVAGDSLMFRKKTTLLHAFISAAPAQGGKTMAQFSSTLLSAEIPLFPGAKGAQFSDNPAQLFFDSGKSMDEVVAFYQQTLAKSGWKPTTDSLIKISIYDVMIFRNAAGDMMRLQLHNFDDQARALIRHSTAAEVAELEALAEEKAKERMKPAPASDDAETLPVDIPDDAQEIEIQRDSIEFQLAAGKARKIVEGWQRDYIHAGWKEQTAVLQDVAGTVLLTNGSKTLTIVYTDVGFMPAEVSIDATGIGLERAK